MMGRDEIIAKAAEAMHRAHSPIPEPKDRSWRIRAVSAYAARFRTGLDAVEDDIRRNERNRCAALIRGCLAAPTPDMAYSALTSLADMLEGDR